jgi:hypothetical protein
MIRQVFVEGERVALELVLLPERNNTLTWKRKDARERPDSRKIFIDLLLLARGSAR